MKFPATMVPSPALERSMLTPKRLMTRPWMIVLAAATVSPANAPFVPVISIRRTASLPMSCVFADAPGCE